MQQPDVAPNSTRSAPTHAVPTATFLNAVRDAAHHQERQAQARAVTLLGAALTPLRLRLRAQVPWWRAGVRRLRAPTARVLLTRAARHIAAAAGFRQVSAVLNRDAEDAC